MANQKEIPTADTVYQASFVSERALRDSYRTEILDIGIFTSETLAIEGIQLCIKANVASLFDYIIDIEYINPTESKVAENFSSFLKEEYLKIESLDSLLKLDKFLFNFHQKIEELKIRRFYDDEQDDFWHPFVAVFYDNFKGFDAPFQVTIKEFKLNEVTKINISKLPETLEQKTE